MLERLHPDETRRRLLHRSDEVRHAWHTRSLPQCRLVLAPLLVLGLVAGIAPGPWRFVAGAFSGVLLAAWLMLPDGRVARLERWRVRHDGHHRTARALRAAGGWVRLPEPGDGPSMVVAGPGGICLIESVCWSGTITVTDGAPVRAFADDPDAAIAMTGVPGRMRRLATERRSSLAAAGAVAHVRPVLVIWGDLADGVVEDAGVTYVRGDLLAEWLTGLRQGLRALPSVTATAA
jgi:hypothetical protein